MAAFAIPVEVCVEVRRKSLIDKMRLINTRNGRIAPRRTVAPDAPNHGRT